MSKSARAQSTVRLRRPRELTQIPERLLAQLRRELQRAQTYLGLYHCFGKMQDNELTREMIGQFFLLLGAASPAPPDASRG